jgi:hypothetical protein
MVRIEINSGSEAGKVVELQPGTHVVGRHPSADLPLPIESVSGRHIELVVGVDGSVRFRDLGSTNGTFSGGVKVTEGEWFAGSELRLGNAELRLIDENAPTSSTQASEVSGDDAAMHARAREAAMAGGRRGGPLMLLLLLVLVVGAGGAYWKFGRSGDPEQETDGAGAVGPGATAVALDLIDDLGRFSEDAAAAWTLAEGQAVEGNRLRSAQAGRRAALVRDFLAAPSLAMQAQVEGGPVWPLIEWGADGEEQGTVFQGAPLSASASELALPEQAAWFRVSLLFGGSGSVQDFRVQDGSADGLAPSSHASRSFVSSAGNLILLHSDGRAVLTARAADGNWATAEGGLDFTPGKSSIGFRAGEALDSAAFFILSDGGPVVAADGVRIDGSSGLLLGEGAWRYLMRFDEPASVVVSNGIVACSLPAAARLRWELTEDMTQASRLARQLKNAANDKDVPGVLAAAGQILRDYPLDAATVSDALARSREVIQEGRATLATLSRERADAEFLQSIDDLVALEAQARSLATAYAGSDLAAQAQEEADALQRSATFLREARAVQAATYRARLTTAIADAYPLLSAWLRAEDQS